MGDPSTIYGLDLVAVIERLGREESSERNARKAFRRQREDGEDWAPVSKFKPPGNSNEISVNRMDMAPPGDIAEIGQRNASRLKKSFWGWYILSASDVKSTGCSVLPSPLLDNPYHADVVVPVPPDAEDRRDAMTEFARDLAYCATFLPWGDWTGEPT